MGYVEHDSCREAVKKRDSNRPQDKKWPGIVAKGKKTLGFGFAEISRFIKLAGCDCTQGIAAYYSQYECGGTGTVYVEKRFHNRLRETG